MTDIEHRPTQRLLSLVRVIGHQRFAIGMTVALWLLLLVPQIREFLLIYRLLSWPGLSEFAFVALSAAATWYAGRLAYRIDPNPLTRGVTRRELIDHRRLRIWLPRLYALLVPLAPANAASGMGLRDKALVYTVLALVLFLIACTRRPLLRMASRGRLARTGADADPVVGRWQKLAPHHRRIVIGTSIAAALMLLLATIAPAAAAAAFGTTGVLFLSGSLLVVLGTVAMQWAQRRQLPFTSLALLLLVVVALIPIGKRHPIDSAAPEQPSEADYRAASMPDPFAPADPVLVAAEGGGIRAAYWTALSLHTLDLLSDGALRSHLTLASGVSGGSLGLATFALSQRADTLDRSACPSGLTAGEIDAAPRLVRALALGHCFLAADYLGPVALRLIWHDALRLFAPIPFFTDRGEALEDGWSRHWQQLTRQSDFERPLSDLDGSGTTWVFNSTDVDSGRRVIQSAPWLPDLATLAAAALDGRLIVGRSITLKQAVHNSARFTYVSPSGSVPGTGRQLVDGGYFENSGLSLINDWLIYRDQSMSARPASTARAAGNEVEADPAAPPIDGLSPKARRAGPIVLLLSNDPAVAPRTGCRSSPPREQRGYDHELLAPAQALLDAREARGEYARDQACRLVRPDNYFQLAIRPGAGVRIPLGWALSAESIGEMQRQLWCDDDTPGSNAAQLLAIVDRIGGKRPIAEQRLRQLCGTLDRAGERAAVRVPAPMR